LVSSSYYNTFSGVTTIAVLLTLLTVDRPEIRIITVVEKEIVMKYIWAPWRIQYILQEKEEGCVLCDKPKQDNDAGNYVLYRGEFNFIMMNLYPYNPGHLLVAPYRHARGLEELTEAERNEHYSLVTRSVTVLREALGADGFNLGANLGRVAGAGIDDHFHSHIVPRWQGDINFMTVMDDVRIVPQALRETYEKLKNKF
jgi:ATP adenylyltransferase